MDEDVLYAYGFVTGHVGGLIRTPDRKGLSTIEKKVLAAVCERGKTHPTDLDAEFGKKRVTNAWGGFSKETKRTLERLHRRGLLRVARRDKGIRVYEPTADEDATTPQQDRFRELVLIAANIFAPAARSRLVAALAPLRRRFSINARAARQVIDELLDDGELTMARVDGVDFVWPAGRAPRPSRKDAVRLLAPFDPVVWDRERFEHFWGWAYRFEAYTPKAKRVRGYYALPMLWRDDVIGWANVSAEADDLDVEVGFVNARPRGRAFTAALDEEIERMRVFLGPR